MPREEGIIDATNLKATSRIHFCDMACLHRYHLFFLEMHHPSTFFHTCQGQEIARRARGGNLAERSSFQDDEEQMKVHPESAYLGARKWTRPTFSRYKGRLIDKMEVKPCPHRYFTTDL